MERRIQLVVIVGILFHCSFLLSIFDIYFRSPIVHGMTPAQSSLTPPARRLVLFVADGLRADKFLESDSTPFLHRIIRQNGAWGVSHARVPTESRPGHVALIAGFYEDVSAVTKGWKTNPVEFDSAFNESAHTWSWGSPDILPMFGEHVPHVHMNCYHAEGEDFASDATGLDTWVFRKVEEFFAEAQHNETVRRLLHQDKTIFFLHLLGIDTNGHAYRPYSKEYLDNIALVDQGVERICGLFERFFNDSATAYIFTSDHGMSNRGSHGDGELANTQTPFVAWGAGIRHALPANLSSPLERHAFTPSVLIPTPPKFADLKRTEINQADVAPLMACLLGIAYPMNSVGILPVSFLNASSRFAAQNLYKNAQQIFRQFTRKSEMKQDTALIFRPFTPLLDYQDKLGEDLEGQDYALVLERSLSLISLSLQGLYYFQTYEWIFLMTLVSLGYAGWVGFLMAIVAEHYASVSGSAASRPISMEHLLSVFGIFTTSGVLLWLESSPVQYYIYALFPIIFWSEVVRRRAFFFSLFGQLRNEATYKCVQLVLFILAIECMVVGYHYREFFSLLLALVAIWVSVVPGREKVGYSVGIKAGWIFACSCLAIFPCLPTELENEILLVCCGGITVFVIGASSLYVSGKLLPSLLVYVELAAVVGASCLVYNTSYSLDQKKGLPPINQVLSWALLGLSLLFPFLAGRKPIAILRSLFLSLAAPFILLSISYEVLFYASLGLTLTMWLITEGNVSRSYHPARKMSMKDARTALFFVLFCYVAFFGTGNIASISSFELSSTYRFMTVFRPFAMGALLLWKVFIPFLLVACTFHVINRSTGAPEAGSFLLVVAISDIMTLHFFFMVKDQGSWKDIGTSISHFAISNMFIIFALALLTLSHFIIGSKKAKQL